MLPLIGYSAIVIFFLFVWFLCGVVIATKLELDEPTSLKQYIVIFIMAGPFMLFMYMDIPLEWFKGWFKNWYNK